MTMTGSMAAAAQTFLRAGLGTIGCLGVTAKTTCTVMEETTTLSEETTAISCGGAQMRTSWRAAEVRISSFLKQQIAARPSRHPTKFWTLTTRTKSGFKGNTSKLNTELMTVIWVSGTSATEHGPCSTTPTTA